MAILTPEVAGAVIGGLVVGAASAISFIARRRRGLNGRESSGHPAAVSVANEQAGRMEVEFWRAEFKGLLRGELLPVVSELQDVVRQLGQIAGMIDPSGRTPRGGLRAIKEPPQ